MLILHNQELADISGYVREKYGVNLAAKSILIESRLGCYIKSKGFESYSSYFDYAKNDPMGTEMANLINRITTNYTYFMREKDHFEIFVKTVLPWIDSLPDRNDLRLWTAGCATGEEPYGLSIYILEYLDTNGQQLKDSTILASDISDRTLAAASKGEYQKENLVAIPDEWINKYFIDLGGGLYRVSPKLRDNVAFKKINLLDPIVARKPFHAIFCRNVMIYFDTETRQSLIERLYEAMAPGAYLFIGHSESLTNYEHGFRFIQPSIYRKPLSI